MRRANSCAKDDLPDAVGPVIIYAFLMFMFLIIPPDIKNSNFNHANKCCNKIETLIIFSMSVGVPPMGCQNPFDEVDIRLVDETPTERLEGCE